MVDHKKVEQAIRLLLEGIGEDPDREGLAETPDRIARMYEEICGGMNEDAEEHLKKTFTAENNEMVVEKDITFYSAGSFQQHQLQLMALSQQRTSRSILQR